MNTENINVNENVEGISTTEETVETKMYSAEDVAKMIQAESDRRTNQALAKQKKEYEKKLSLSSLDEQQRKEAEAQMRIEELQSQLAAFQLEKNKSELKSVLASRGLDVRFADVISITEDLEVSQQNIDTLDKLFKAAVKAEVEKRLAGNTPMKGVKPTELTKDSAKSMSIAEINALAQSDPEAFKKLFN